MSETKVSVGDIVFTGTDLGITLNTKVYKVQGDEYWAEIELQGTQAATAWKMVQVSDNFDSFAFGQWLDGDGLPVWWGDLDADGKPELLAPLPKGDISPALFRVFRWTGDDLLFLKKRALLAVGDEGDFVWSTLENESQVRQWIETFREGQAEVWSLVHQVLKKELVPVTPTSEGFRKSGQAKDCAESPTS